MVNPVEQESLVGVEALTPETSGGCVVGSGGCKSNRIDPKFWLAAPIRPLIFGCEPRNALWADLLLNTGLDEVVWRNC